MKMRIMFVCHGNICRSPMAEFIMKKLISDAGASHLISASSSATSTEEIWNGVGSPFYTPAKSELKKHGVPFSERRATLLVREDYCKYDLFIGMDNANIRNMHRIFGSDPEKKIRKLMEYCGNSGDVSDPWYSRNFDAAFRDIYKGCEALLAYLLSEYTLKQKTDAN